MLPTIHYLHAAAKAADSNRKAGILHRILVRVHADGTQSIAATCGRLLVRYTTTEGSGPFFTGAGTPGPGAWQLDPADLPKASRVGAAPPSIDGDRLTIGATTIAMVRDDVRPYPPVDGHLDDRVNMVRDLGPALSFDAGLLEKLRAVLHPGSTRTSLAHVIMVGCGRGIHLTTGHLPADGVRRDVLLMPISTPDGVAQARFPGLTFPEAADAARKGA